MSTSALSMPILDSAGFWMICGGGTEWQITKPACLTRAAAYPRRRRPHIRQCGDDDPQRDVVSLACVTGPRTCVMSARLLRRYPSYAVKGNLDRDPLSGDLVDPQLDFGEVAGAERLADLVLVVDVAGTSATLARPAIVEPICEMLTRARLLRRRPAPWSPTNQGATIDKIRESGV